MALLGRNDNINMMTLISSQPFRLGCLLHILGRFDIHTEYSFQMSANATDSGDVSTHLSHAILLMTLPCRSLARRIASLPARSYLAQLIKARPGMKRYQESHDPHYSYV